MITLCTWSTPNGMKVHIMLEECNLPYRIAPINLTAKEQHSAAFHRLNPNGKIPVILDDDGMVGQPLILCESGAILFYLAEKSKYFDSLGSRERYKTLQWVMFQMSFIGPMFGQYHHFIGPVPQPQEYAVERYRKESERLLGVLDCELHKHAYIVGQEYGIADICTWPWIRSWQNTMNMDIGSWPNVNRWYRVVAQRPAIEKAVDTYICLRDSKRLPAGYTVVDIEALP